MARVEVLAGLADADKYNYNYNYIRLRLRHPPTH